MLPEISLDQQSFREILDDAVKQISRVYPAWTNYNAADPGITLLELFSWFQEMQQYHLDQIGEKNERKFLKLLGVCPERMQAATALVHVTGLKEDLLLREAELFFAGGIPFETAGRQQLVKANVALCRSLTEEGTSDWDLLRVEPGRKIRFAPFGQRPQKGDTFALGFDSPLPTGSQLSLYFQVFDGHPVKRNPIGEGDGFQPLARLRWEVLTSQGWRDLTLVEDGSHQLLQSGFLRFCLEEPMASGEDGMFWLRAVVEQSWYEVAPVLTGVYGNLLEVAQKNTLADFREYPAAPGETIEISLAHRLEDQQLFLQREGDGFRQLDEDSVQLLSQEDGSLKALVTVGEGAQAVRVLFWDAPSLRELLVAWADGFPGQSYRVEAPGIMAQDLELLVKEPDGLWHVWTQVEDFDSSTPEDRHFCFEESLGRLSFGDGEKGMAPEGQIRLERCAVSEGVDGNVKQNQIHSGPSLPDGVQVTNYWLASGGRQGETLAQCFLRARARLHHSERAVTGEDFEEKVRNAPGLMIQNCRCVPVSRLSQKDGMGENGVAVVVQPFSDGRREKLNEGYYRNLYGVLDRCRLLGTRVRVLSPEYIGITVYAEIRIRPYYQGAEQRIRETVERFFHTADWIFGEPVQYSALYGCLDTLDCVLAVESLIMEARGTGVSRNRSGDVILPPNGLVFLSRAEYNWKDGE